MPLAKAVLGGALLGALVAIALSAMFLVGVEGMHASKIAAGVLGAEIWDPGTGKWSSAGALTTPRVAPDLDALEDGRVLVSGGSAEEGGSQDTSALLWSASTRTVESIGGPEIATECWTSVRLPGSRILFASSHEEPAAWGIGAFHASLYDVGAGKWSKIEMTPDKGVRAVAPLDERRVLFVFQSSTAVWDRETREWTRGPGPVGGPTLECTDAAFAQPLADGRVLVVSTVFHPGAGGWAWSWQPATNALVRAAALEHALVAADPAHAAEEMDLNALSLSAAGGVVLLGDRAAYVAAPGLDSVSVVPFPEDAQGAAAAVVGGRVLLAGGAKPTSATLVDLATKQVTRTGSLAMGRSGASAAALPDGRVLILGGTVEQWDVSWGRFAALAALGIVVLALLVAVVWLGKRTARRAATALAAIATCAVFLCAAFWMLLQAIGSAIKG